MMKRTRKLVYDTEYGRTTVTIEVERSNLMRGELDTATTSLTDGVMRAIHDAAYIRAPISKIKVK